MSEYWGWDGVFEGLVAKRSLNNWSLRKIGGNAVVRTELEKEENVYPLFLLFVCTSLIDFAYFGLTILQISKIDVLTYYAIYFSTRLTQFYLVCLMRLVLVLCRPASRIFNHRF